MIRVYVETNFLVELLRPLPGEEARALYFRHGKDVQLVIPWCSFKEVERTLLDEVIDRDIGFAGNAGRVWASLRREDPDRWQNHGRPVQEFLNTVRDLRSQAREDCVRRIEELSRRVVLIPPSESATQRALEFSRTKRLKPFDEMIIGCVLADAGAQPQTQKKYWCSTNTGDFRPGETNNLAGTYAAVGLTYLSDFEVP